jgi:Ca2+-binding EF-hand superfamily protein
VLKLLRDIKKSWIETTGVGIVAQIAGDVGPVFRKIDVDDNGGIDKEEELAQLFVKVECDATSSDELDAKMEELDANHDGKQILSRVRTIFSTRTSLERSIETR